MAVTQGGHMTRRKCIDLRSNLTPREQRRQILDRLDTLTQAIRDAKRRADSLDISNALTAALANATAAQRHMESINE